jgi:hypothetical protein
MCIIRLALVSSVLIGVGVAAVAPVAAAVTLRIGEVDGANATFAFDVNAKPPAIVLRTTRVGVAGSRIEVTVDRAKVPLFSHVFAPGECKFGEGGSACEVTIPAKDVAYRAILTGFKRGLLARVTVQDAGVMKMDQTASLKGFANRLR